MTHPTAPLLSVWRCSIALAAAIALLSAVAWAGEPPDAPPGPAGAEDPSGGARPDPADGSGGEPASGGASPEAEEPAPGHEGGGAADGPPGSEPPSAGAAGAPAEPVEGGAAAAQEPAPEPPEGEPPRAGAVRDTPSAAATEPHAIVAPSPSGVAAPAAPAADSRATDRFEVQMASDTVMRLFERAQVPGPGGALVQRPFAAPLYEYASLRIRDLDTPWQADSVDIELASWGSLDWGEVGDRRRIDGDITVASVRHRFGPAYVMLGRQVRAGGAARFARFDGVSAGLEAPFGLGADGYGGFVVLPRWSARPGYHLLGSATDTLVRSPDALPDPSREEYWLAGGRVYYAHPSLGEVGTSYHEQAEAGELGRRNLAMDLRATPHEMVDATAQAIVDGDAWDLADFRAAVDVYPIEPLSLAAEYQHAVPALFLSRQSVLSVFSTDAFDEVGGSATYRLLEPVELGAGGYVDVFGDSSVGMRLVGRVRFEPLGSDRLVLQVGYRRVTETDNGYHGVRVAAGYRVIERVRLTGESYWYVYDEPVRAALARPTPSTLFSWVGATSTEWTLMPGWTSLLGGSLSSTPYAALDLQAVARLRIDLWWGEGS